MLKILTTTLLSFILFVPLLGQTNIYFDFDKSDLNESELSKLAFLKNKKDSIIKISAHTDTVGNRQYNLILAQKRLVTVLNYLQINSSITTLVMGETKDSTSDNLNRRVSIQFVSKMESLPTLTKEPPNVVVKKRINFNKIYFYPSTPVFKPESQETLKELLKTIQQLAGEKIELRGHINHPSWYGPITEEHKQLSYNRAKAVYEYLQSNAVDVTTISIKGMSNTEMVFPQPINLKEMEMNMRVEVVVLQ